MNTNVQTWVVKLGGLLSATDVLTIRDELLQCSDDQKQEVAENILTFLRIAYGGRPSLDKANLKEISIIAEDVNAIFCNDWEPFFDPDKQSGHVVEAVFYRCLERYPSLQSLTDYYEGYITGTGQYV